MMASVSMPSTSLPTPADHQQSSIAAEISAPIHVSGADGMRAAEVRIQFDPSEVTTDASQIRSGSVWGGHAAVIANVDQEAGTIVAFVFSASPVTTGDGELIDIDFTLQPNATFDGAIVIDVQKVRLNEGHISLTNEPAVGSDASDGRIETSTIVQPRRIRGTFIADTISDDENCAAVPAQSNDDHEGASFHGPQVQRMQAASPRTEMQGPLAPQTVDNVFEHMLDSQAIKKHDFNVRATWRH